MECRRDDGNSTRCPMAKQGILPHDFIHYVVEDTLNLRRGFYGWEDNEKYVFNLTRIGYQADAAQ